MFVRRFVKHDPLFIWRNNGTDDDDDDDDDYYVYDNNKIIYEYKIKR